MPGARVADANKGEDNTSTGPLFEGRKFWIAQRCPMRTHFVEEIKRNGGAVVQLEKQADWLIVDDIRKDIPPGSTSYKFIDQSLKAGRLLDPFAFACGPIVGSVRPVGSISRPAKAIRRAFTPEDDRVLREWVMSCMKNGAVSDMGNKIFQQLEAENDRHTWQSWRDRWVKRLRNLPHEGPVPQIDNSPPTPPSEENEPAPPPPPVAQPNPQKKASSSAPPPAPMPSSSRNSLVRFSAEELHQLFRVARSIQDMKVREVKQAFTSWAADSEGPAHTGEEWQTFWDLRAQPIFEIIEAEQGRMKAYRGKWLEWSRKNQDATADEWILHWEENVRPQVESIISGREEVDDWDESSEANNEEDDDHLERMVEANIPRSQGTPAKGSSREVQPSPTPKSARESGMVQKSPSKQSSQPTKRHLGEVQIYEDEPDEQYNPTSKRQRTVFEGATRAGLMLNEVLEQNTRKGALAEPIEILDSSSSASSEDEQDSVPQRMTERLPQDTPEETHDNAATNNSMEDILQGNAEDELPGDEDDDVRLNKPASPTLSFAHFPSDAADQTQFPNIMPFDDPFDDDEILGSSPPPLRAEAQALDTQAILTAETQPFQFTLPDPFSNDDDVDAPTVQPYIDSQDLEMDEPEPIPPVSLAVHIANLIAQGHAEANILVSLRSTSMDRELAVIVLESLETGGGIPEDVKGVWTKKDDEDAEGGDARMIRRVRKKHGEEGLAGYLGRLEFLRQYRLR